MHNSLSVVDLFCGAGGFSKGFEMAGFDILLGLDNWEDATETFKHNHVRGKVICENVKEVNGDDINKLIGKSPVDVVIGGPPCQGFSISGKRDSNDLRNNLIYEFYRLTLELSPKYFVMENVEGLVSLNEGSYLKNLIQGFKKNGYNVDYRVLNSADYGVPQTRKRVFLIGNNLDNDIDFPKPTHFPNTKENQELKLFEKHYGETSQRPYVTLREAIEDLPSLKGDLNLKGEPLGYQGEPENKFQMLMRDADKVYNHQGTDHWDKTKRMVSRVPEGGNWRDIPEEVREEQNFNARYTRLDGNKPSITIDTGHRHHFHYEENRVPTVREKARIQSFPDSFIFLGSKTSQNRQVGNAVPCLLAKSIAETIKEKLR